MIGLNIIVSDHATELSAIRLFPASKNRSKRVHKKLVKRFGGEFRQKPAIFKTSQGLIVHPALYAQVRAAMAPRTYDRNPW